MVKVCGKVFFVSPGGDDSWSGELETPNSEKTDGPFATISRAKDAVREIKNIISEPIYVVLRGGKYFLDETLVFDQKDSGTKECPITYMAYPGEKPIVSGGRKIDGPWKIYDANIMVCNVKEVKDGNGILDSFLPMVKDKQELGYRMKVIIL